MRRALSIAACALALAGCGVAGEPGVEAVGAGTEPTDGSASPGEEIAPEARVGGTIVPGSTLPSDLVVTGAALPSTAAVVGDSLVASAADEIESTLSGLGVEVIAIDAVESRRMTSGSDSIPPGIDAIDAILAAAPVPPEVWVVALGTNDVGGSARPDEIASDVEAVLGLIPAEAEVVWVDLWVRDLRDEIVAANATIRQVVGRRAGSVVADWFAHGDESGVLTDDGVHLTDDGQWMYARTIADAVGELDR